MPRQSLLLILVLLLSACAQAKDFSGTRALDYTAKAVSFGPRPPNSPAIHKLQAYIIGHLKTTGCAVTEDNFTATTPQGPVPMKNIICKFPGKSGKAIVVSGHYDTKNCAAPIGGCQEPHETPNFVGANDGGSSTGFLMEMANVLQGAARKDDVYLVFFDGEEAYGEWTDTNSLYGSRHLADKWAAEGLIPKIKALINVDMIGDKDLNLAWNSGSAMSIETLVWDTAARLGYGKNFPHSGGVTGDDHVPFLQKGVKSVDLIDFDDDYWHTPKDTMDKLSANSLLIVGTVVQAVLRQLEDQN
jgi:glutaminyl-peptide cyclotransferase